MSPAYRIVVEAGRAALEAGPLAVQIRLQILVDDLERHPQPLQLSALLRRDVDDRPSTRTPVCGHPHVHAHEQVILYGSV